MEGGDGLIQKALNGRYAIIHVMGPQYGEKADDIIKRKLDDVRKGSAKFTLWAQHSRLAKPDHVRALCAKGEVFLYLIADRRRGRTSQVKMPGQQTKGRYRAATHYNPRDRESNDWHSISDLNISDVTDNRASLNRHDGRALVLGLIEVLDEPFPIRMEQWADTTRQPPVPSRTGQGYSVVCAERRDMSQHPSTWMKERVIIAVAPIIPPFAVWLK